MTTITDEELRQLLHTAKPYTVGLMRWGPNRHIDNHGEADDELALGTGVVDWGEVTRLIDRHCDQPVAVIETSTLEEIRDSLTFLEAEHVYPFNQG